jgi:starch synthase
VRIALAASEAVPFCKTGGLADVVGAMAGKLGAAGHDVCLFLPKYRNVEAEGLGPKGQPLALTLGGTRVEASLRYVQRRSVSVCLIDYPVFFDRESLYTKDGRDYPDNDRRFALFSRGVLEALKVLGFKPDVVHAHDWQAGLIPALLKTDYASDPFFASTASVFTVHNMAYQGNFPRAALDYAGLPADEFRSDRLEYHGQISYLKAGLVHADQLTTVSPTYAREIQESGERGFGMEGVLRQRSASLTGVLNGLDLEIWSPERDPHLPRAFGAGERAAGKAACKAAVQKECGLPQEPRRPLAAVISRLDYQKGLDVAIQAIESRLDRCQLVVVGTGDPALQEAFIGLERRHPGAVKFRQAFDDPFAHRLYAACDLFLMPSRFEPCGLGQLIAMRYGAVPVASRTGGLADTVIEGGERANGFLAAPGDAAELASALDRALARYSSAGWDALAAAAMKGDFSWERSMALYVDVYRRALAGKAR